MSTASLETRFRALERLLRAHEPFWSVSPFHVPRPAWVTSHGALARELLALPQARLQALARDDEALRDRLARHLPGLRSLGVLARDAGADPPEPTRGDPERLFTHVPGAKRCQVEAFVATLEGASAPAAPILEWCAGKGHLGRWLARRHGRPVTSIEIDPRLCRDGARLAARVGAEQRFECRDVLAPDARSLAGGRHAVALHACGDLHRRLVEDVVRTRAPALDLAPCCYDRTAGSRYRPLAPGARLAPDRTALRLAVTDLAAGACRDRRRWAVEPAWKLAWKQLRPSLGGRPFGAGIAPVPRAWLRDGFRAYVERLAAREGKAVPAATDWPALEAEGRRLAARFDRLNLVRLAFRRSLECWLVLDLAVALLAAGYRVSVRVFAQPTVTPRNLLVSARWG